MIYVSCQAIEGLCFMSGEFKVCVSCQAIESLCFMSGD